MPTDSRDGATARPWRVECISDCVRIVVGEGRQKIILARLAPKQLSEHETKANAELIVAAVNDHDALVEKVRALAAKWDAEVKAKESNGEWAESVKRCRVELLRALGDGR